MQDQLGRRGSSGPFQLERAHVVIREQLGLVLSPTDRLNPFRHSTVLVSTFGTWDLPISDVSYEDMVERVFRLSFDGGAPFTANAVSPDEGAKTLFESVPFEAVDGCQRRGPEDLS